MHALDDESILSLWEAGSSRRMLDRSLLLGAWARPELAADALADLDLGGLTGTLLRMHAASFGPALACILDCQSCGERLELVLDADALLRAMPAASGVARVEAAGLHLRAPCARDLAAVAHEVDSQHAARVLLARCAGTSVDAIVALSEAAFEAAEAAVEALDPNADLSFEVHCELCGARSAAQLDVGLLLWQRLDSRARTLLREIHALASGYGWTEREILSLGATRRATYLAMVEA